MMPVRTILFGLVAAVVFGTSVAAATVTISGGEHDGFTRLTVPIAPGFDWQAGRDGASYAIRIADAPTTLDTARVMRRLYPDRVRAITETTDTGVMNVTLGCSCYMTAFLHGAELLVLDFHDGPPPAEARFETAIPSGPAVSGGPAGRPVRRPIPPISVKDAPEQGYDWRDMPAPEPMTLVGHAYSGTANDVAGFSDLRDSLIHHISRAATEGVIALQPRGGDEPLAAATPAPATDGDNLDILTHTRTSVDIATGKNPLHTMTQTGAACPDAAAFDLAAWGDDRPAAEQIASLRARLVGEFDKPSPEDVAALARLFIHLGFGAESRQLLQQLGNPEDVPPSLTGLAQLVDGGSGPESAALAEFTACPSAVALWALLAVPGPTPATPIARQDVLLTFSALPAHLRGQLGEELSRKLISAGDRDAARYVRDVALRGNLVAPGSAALMNARIAEAAGNHIAAAQDLAHALPEAGVRTEDAMVMLIEQHFQTRAPIGADVVVAVSSLLHQARGGSAEAGLSRAQALARALNYDFEGAFAGLQDIADEDLHAATKTDLLAFSADHAPDEDLLKLAVGSADSVPGTADAAWRLTIAARLDRLGFPAEAMAWITDTGGDDPEVAQISAKAALSQGQPEVALRAIADQDGTAAAALRARAFLEAGQFKAAASTYSAAGDTAGETEALWLAGDTAGFAHAAPNDPRLQLVQTPEPPQDEGVLTRDRRILGESRGLRSALAAILSTPVARQE